MVATVSQSQPSARILIWAAEGISAFNVALVQLIPRIDIFSSIYCKISLRWMPQDLTDDWNIGSGNGLVLSGEMPLPKPMQTQICIAIGKHWTSVSQPMLVYYW